MTRARRWLGVAAAVGLLGLWSACLRDLTLEADPTAPDAGVPCATSEACAPGFMCQRDAGVCVRERPWGEYAAVAMTAPCVGDGGWLVVNTTEDELELDGGLSDPAQAGPTLSLAEALAIAIQRPGPDTIVFDPAVFPVDAPATITSSRNLFFTGDGAPFCVDGRQRGVVLDWQGSGSWEFVITEGSMVVGLTFLNVARAIQLHGVLAACRWNHDGTRANERAGDYRIASSGQLGPGNSLAGNGTVVSLMGINQVIGNFFGWDPLSERVLPVVQPVKIELPGQSQIVGNVFVGGSYGINAWGDSKDLRIALNYFGTNQRGDVLPRPDLPLRIAATPTVRIGPGNVFREGGMGIMAQFLTTDWSLHVSRNRFPVVGADRAAAITYAYAMPPPPPPPTLAARADGSLYASCGGAPGFLEVFRVAADGTSEFLWEQVCVGEMNLTEPVASGEALVATFGLFADGNAFRTSPYSEPLTVP